MKQQPNQSEGAWLGQVFDELEVPLVAYATQLLGDPDRARDVVQDAFVQLCRGAKGDSDGSVRAWLFRVCRNRAIDILKKEKRMKTIQPSDTGGQASRDGDPVLALEKREAAAQASSLLDGLPDNQREVIRLKVQGGLSYREISDLTGHSVSNVGFLLHTGLKTIRNRLATDGHSVNSTSTINGASL